MFIQYNPNPLGKSTGDCVIRAISQLLDKSWDEVYVMLCVYGYLLKDWGSSNSVWERYLYDLGFQKEIIKNTCPDCYTVRDFCFDTKQLNDDILLATGTHVIAIKNGNYYDSWDSGNEVPIYYYWRDGDYFKNLTDNKRR